MTGRVWRVCLCVSLALFGCRDSAAQLVVVVSTDYPPDEMTCVRARAGVVGGNVDERPVELPLPFSFGVLPPGGDVSASVRVEVEGYGPPGCDGPALVRRVAQTGFRSGTALRLPMFLGKACEGFDRCAPDETCAPDCSGGACVASCVPVDVPVDELREVTPGAELDDPDGGLDAGPSDAGPPDAGPPDAGSPDAGCVESPCGLLPQCGCGADESCTFLDGAPVCTTSGSGAVGDACAEHTDCAAGLDCLANAGRCVAYCRTSATCTPPEQCLFMDTSDPIGICVDDTCDVVLDTGCAPGTTCRLLDVFDEAGAVRDVALCVPAGALSRGEECTEGIDCGPGLQCFGVAALGGTCRPYCNGTPDCGAADSLCTPLRSGDPPPGFCTDSCDLLDGSGCGAGRTCLVVTLEGFGGAPFLAKLCAPAGSGAYGAPCVSTIDCVAGAACVDSVCRQVCDRGSPACTGGRCRMLTPEPRFAGVRYGACI